MKASIRKMYGPPSSIQLIDISKPVLKEKEVLIRVINTTVNRTDCANLTGKPFIMRFILGLFKPKNIILGTDFSGEIEALGEQVKSLNIHDRVFGFNDAGTSSHAEYIAISEADALRKIPNNINYKEAAASLEGASYAYAFIQKVNIEVGQHILINGATGGIGSALLQFVRQYDVKITATCSSENIALVQSLGADYVVDFTKEDFTKHNKSYDFIFDAVGKSTFMKCKRILKPRGIYISSEPGPYAQNLFFALFSKKAIFPKPYPIKTSMKYISQMLIEGKFKPIIDKEFSLNDVSQAYEYVLSGQKIGNVIININGL